MNSKKLLFGLIALQTIFCTIIKTSELHDRTKEINPLRHIVADLDNIYSHTSSESILSLIDEQSESEINLNSASNEVNDIFNLHKQKMIQSLQDEATILNQQNLYSGSAGIVVAGTCLYAGKIIENLSKSQKRIFIIDDLMAAGAANATLQAILPSALALIAGIFTYRQFDYYLHAEERSHFVVLEHKFENAFKEIKNDVIKEFAARDKKYTTEYKKIFKYVDDSSHKIVQNLEHKLASLQKHQIDQADLIQDMKNDAHENNEHLQEKIIRAHQSSEKAVTKITELQATITEYKQNYSTMTATFQKMHPLMNSIHAKIMQSSHQELKSLHTSQSKSNDADDEKEEKEDNSPRPRKTTSLKKQKSAWHNLMNSVVGHKSQK